MQTCSLFDSCQTYFLPLEPICIMLIGNNVDHVASLDYWTKFYMSICDPAADVTSLERGG